MTDDERRLAERLRRYESHIPVEDQAPAVVRPGRNPRWVLAAAVVVVGVVILAANLGPDDGRVGGISPTPTVPSESTADPSAGHPDAARLAAVELHDAGRRLFLTFGGYMESCTDYEAAVTMAGAVLEVLVTPTEEVIACEAAMVERNLTVALDPPFNGTTIRDLATGRTFAVNQSATPAPTPSAAMTAVPTPSPVTGWALTGTFGTDEQQPTFVFDAAVWRGEYVAVGARLPRFAGDSGPYPGQPLLWTSATGESWVERPLLIDLPGGDQADARVEHVVALADGRLMVVYSQSGGTLAWASSDGMAWASVDLGIDAMVEDVAQGPQGYVMVGVEQGLGSGERWQVWNSADGLDWSLVRDEPSESGVQLAGVDAGPEGFVVVGARRIGLDRPYILASSDGVTWHEAPEQPAFEDGDFPFDVAALGGDWIATGFGAEEGGGRAVVWRSANGLDWTRDLGPADPDGRNTHYATDIGSDGGQVVLSPARAQLGGPFQFPTYAWSTTDGVTWATLRPNESYVTEVVSNGTTVVSVGTLGRGRVAAFWIGIAD